MFESVTKLWAKQPERESHQMTAEPSARSGEVVAQQPTSNQEMSADQSKMNLRGGGEGEDICCGVCAGLACFECCECCC